MTAPSDHRDGPRLEVTAGSGLGEDSGPAVTRDVLTLAEAKALAEGIREWLDLIAQAPSVIADRARIESDFAGLREHQQTSWPAGPDDYDEGCQTCWRVDFPPNLNDETSCADLRRYSDGLRRTAALYGITS